MSCPIGSELTLDRLFQEQLVRLGGRRYPFTGTFELTERCNLDCTHCYINRPPGSKTALAKELPTPDVLTILDQVAEAGCLSLLFTGGEILLRGDFPRIYRHALQRGLLVTLFTNGTLLTERIAALLAEWQPHRLEITLYGATQESHERVTRVAGSYARCRAGIDLALRHNLPLALKTVVMRSNRHELHDMRKYAASLGVEFRYDGVLWPRVDGAAAPETERLPPEEIVALDACEPERVSEWQRLLAEFAVGRGDLVFGCGAGRHAFHIDCSGRLSPCIMARRPALDLLEAGFDAAWGALADVIEEKRDPTSVCLACPASSTCIQCPGWSQMVHGDNATPVPFVCELGRRRAARFGPPAV